LNHYNNIHPRTLCYFIELPFGPDDFCWEKLTDEVYLLHLEKALVTDLAVGPNASASFTQNLSDLRFNFNRSNY